MKEQIYKYAMYISVVACGILNVPAQAQEPPPNLDGFHEAIQTDGGKQLTKDQLLDHLVQAAQAGCRCCGRCACGD
jgi:hypothetical protein